MNKSIPFTSSIRDFFDSGVFNPQAAIMRLQSDSKLNFGEADLLRLGMLCWIFEPVDCPEFLRSKLSAKASELWRGRIRNLKKRRMENGKTIPGEAATLVLRHINKTRWLADALDYFAEHEKSRALLSRTELKTFLHREARYAAYAADLMAMHHFYSEAAVDWGSQYGPPSIEKVCKAVAGLIKEQPAALVGEKIESTAKKISSAETLRRDVWGPRTAKLAWQYAAASIMIRGVPLVAWFAKQGRVPLSMRKNFDILAGRARFVQETILARLHDSVKVSFGRFVFPESVASITFEPRAFLPAEIKVIKGYTRDNRRSGGGVQPSWGSDLEQDKVSSPNK